MARKIHTPSKTLTLRKTLIPGALLGGAALVLAGCASTPTDASDDGAVQVVASTSVYGDIVRAIAGDAVEVTSIISSTSQDPHSYEASASDQLTVSRADLIIENGGGYDAFIDGLIDASGSTAHVITAAEYSHDWPENEGHDHAEGDDHGDDHDDTATDDTATEDAATDDHAEGDDHAGHDHVEGFNEHVWYDPHTIEHVAEAIAEELTELVPGEKATFDSGLADFVAGIGDLETSLADVAAAHEGDKIFVTEPVPLYLTAAAGLENVTPEAFSEAVEEGQDVPPATLLEATRLIDAGDVRAVIVNAQTGGAETTQVIQTAEAAGIPVVEFSEILPDGQSYLTWMAQNIDDLEAALAS
ncbi:MAG: zinc ABC transporter substrate-binding protein [Candidatus Microbacterium phytovorans]|uniref:Zinc ABC transporter substrate-binding protein n=1 Tax=Candidatus Microbacterium phytovorans TaxID=3121374 RepID=A0AAJ5W078_9MICO|nr:zinc ABC transporter substrate-binding protein [Microbacterium sp.]WEK13090.1 MAG: zinc ABC transporter substrate-binding protein [Microbacterium sp.]